MTRFAKEALRRGIYWVADDSYDDSIGSYCKAEDALIVNYHPSIIEVYELQRDGGIKDVTNDRPEISAPYLVKLCGGNLDSARQILKSQPCF